jgi:predicted RNA-binding protein with TRAM domain
MAKFLIIKGKESFYIKAMKKIQDDENCTKWLEVNQSQLHERVPENKTYERVNILKSGLIYTFDKTSGKTHIEGYTLVVPQVSVGMLILKPVLQSYYKSFLKNSNDAI